MDAEDQHTLPHYLVCQSSWAGITYTPVEIVERQPKRVKVRFLQDTLGRKAGRIGYPPYKSVGHWDGNLWIPLAREH